MLIETTSEICLTSVAALTISIWPLWIWIFQKKLLNNFSNTQPVSLKEEQTELKKLLSLLPLSSIASIWLKAKP